MISSVYVAMGIVMICAARNPEGNKAFVDFLIIANTLHAATMTFFAVNIYHLLIDSLFIGLMGILPLILYSWKLTKFSRY